MSVYSAIGPSGFGSYRIEWVDGVPQFERVTEAPHRILVPGFVDVHIHGGFGIDFMSASRQDMETLCRGLGREGYEHFLATTVTASLDSVLKAFESLPDDPIVAGIHLEGPFISHAMPGAQPKNSILEPASASDWDQVWQDPRLKIVTLAPEQPGALELTSRLLQRGVHVNMGHTNATYEEARRGSEFGARGVTHMFNAMRPFHHREAGTVGYALQDDGLFTELIYDRKHVCKEAAQLLFKCKPAGKVVAISDGTQAIGLPPGNLIDLWGVPGIVGKEEVRTISGDTLAGSAVTLHTVFCNLAEDFGLETAIRCCCFNPRQVLNLKETPKVWVEMDMHYKVIEIHSHLVTESQ